MYEYERKEMGELGTGKKESMKIKGKKRKYASINPYSANVENMVSS